MKVRAIKNGRLRTFKKTVWDLMPVGNYGWTATDLPVTEPKEVQTPPEVKETQPLPEKVSISTETKVETPVEVVEKPKKGRKPNEK